MQLIHMKVIGIIEDKHKVYAAAMKLSHILFTETSSK